MKQLWLVLVLGCGSSSSPSTGVDAPTADASIDERIDASDACTEGATRPCGTDVGACEAGVETCTAGVWSACTGGVIAATELCDGALDENCDGTVDEACPTDPFDPASCGGPPMTAVDATALLGAASRSVLANATMQIRTRTCSGTSCSAWSASANWVTRFLTYSGGVVTRYKDVQADTRLVVYNDNGTPKLSLQHVTFTQGGYPDGDGIVFAFPPAAQPFPVFRAFNVMPAFPSDYEDLELTLKNGELVLGTKCARFTATVFGATEPYTTSYAALYRW